jgi:3'(2'), 5'-bisphosphate nucleotidase
LSETLITEAQKSQLRSAMLAAGRVILEVREAGKNHTLKGDGSPVTEADTRAEAILLEALGKVLPDIPVVAEEAAEAGHIPKSTDLFFLVDPLDGTKEFIRGGEDFTVNIGLIHKRRPVYGLIYTPVNGHFYEGEVGAGAWKSVLDCKQTANYSDEKPTPIQVRRADPSNLMAVASRSHRAQETNDWLNAHHVKDTVSAGSSLKFCLLAEGRADVYPRHGPTMEWDTAAGHAILIAAGGQVYTLDGEDFLYAKDNQERPYLNPGFIAWGSR